LAGLPVFFILQQDNFSFMPLFTDQLGRTISLHQYPKKIISLVPSQTELLHTLGLEEEVKGITKFCKHPQQWFRNKATIGGTKDVRMEKIHAIKPDLIIANKEENDREQIEELSRHYPVWISNVQNLPDALQMITAIGELTGRDQQARSLFNEISKRFDALAGSPDLADKPPASAAYFIWRNPWMVAGGDTFIHDMLKRCGFHNLFETQSRYPVIELEQLTSSSCKYVLLSSEPYPFRDQHIAEINAILPHATIRLVDGEMFSWYGSRLLEAPAYFQRLAKELLSSK
jgi:ABC-type Fe3+-hydroxamate transport system substrate-binding protein